LENITKVGRLQHMHVDIRVDSIGSWGSGCHGMARRGREFLCFSVLFEVYRESFQTKLMYCGHYWFRKTTVATPIIDYA